MKEEYLLWFPFPLFMLFMIGFTIYTASPEAISQLLFMATNPFGIMISSFSILLLGIVVVIIALGIASDWKYDLP